MNQPDKPILQTSGYPISHTAHKTDPIHGAPNPLSQFTTTTATKTMANLTTNYFFCTKPSSLFINLNLKQKHQSRLLITSMSSATTTSATKVIPSIIVGGGRVGQALQQMGGGQDLLVKRGQLVPVDFPGPILVCTRNDDLDAVLQSTPQSRWSGIINQYLIY